MRVSDLDDNTIQVIPPTYRVDITREADLMEEVARLEGYDNIEVTYPSIKPSDESELPSLDLRAKVSEIMIGLGFSEIITYSFISPDSINMLGAENDNRLRSFVKLQNPLTIDQSVMRTSLVPGLLTTIIDNIAYGEKDLKLFEWGKIFLKNASGELPSEKLFLSGIMTGSYRPKEWYNEAIGIDFYDIKGAVELLFRSLGIKDIAFKKYKPEPGYHPDFSYRIFILNSFVGNLGQMDPDVIERYGLKAEKVYLFEIDIDVLLANIRKTSIKFEPFTNYPAVMRDLSIIVDRNTESGIICDIIKREGKGLVESVKVFDIYEGEKIGLLKKSISYRICYRSKKGTLDGSMVNRLHETIIDRIREETGGTLSEG